MKSIAALVDFMIGRRFEILEQTVEHIGLTVMALTIAVLIGLPIGIILTRRKKVSSPVLGIIGIIQTIPSVALLGFLLPLLGIGVIPAIVALFLYALLPIVRNTFTGIEEVDPSVREAAVGMGMSDWQILSKVELPLAVPVIFAGIRTATVINVGIATLCALIGSGGLGEFIFRGIALNNINMILAGAIPAALLALIFDLGLGIIQKFIHRIFKPFLLLSFILVFVVVPFFIAPSFFSTSFTAGFTAEFMERQDGYPGLRETYSLSLETVELDPGLMYQALKQKKVDLICGFSTDGRIKAYHFKVLEDDKNYFPPYHAAPLVRGSLLRRYPVLKEIFENLKGKIPNEKMAAMNYRVDHDKVDPVVVAETFLKEMEIVPVSSGRKKGRVIIGSKNFTEQYILAHVFSLLIEYQTELEAVLKTGLGGTKICFDALRNGEIDLYPEYSGTVLLVLLESDKTELRLLREEGYIDHRVRSGMKERFDMEWLQPLGFNNTYALLMRRRQAERWKIETISDLKVTLEEKATYR
ncbi:MAG: ABC transporter permease/substrate-binding protein [Candidatus Aminicenantes bacterium]|nr:ABC transporter permease/substrate-binding protein [Candidatus Aminicenantes bacterium]